MPLSPDDFIAELWTIARQVPMMEHPWFKGIIEHRWTREQIVLGEIQHYLRVRTNPIFFGYIAINAVQEKNYGLMEVVLDNFMEELGGERTHVDIMLQFLEEAGISREEADRADPAPGTQAAIERYATDPVTQEKVRRAVRLGVNAFNFEWDGHVQAMTRKREYWSGKSPLRMKEPEVRLKARA